MKKKPPISSELDERRRSVVRDGRLQLNRGEGVPSSAGEENEQSGYNLIAKHHFN